ncbi:MAG TPA: hypothetical protein VMF06_13085 [Candidatus Limnocylindria bacterium]|jgi:hypothetical protein|nr:hypothetical protein [Candidatus Limnocylindria bacterium]
MQAADNILKLRQLLEARLPHVRVGWREAPPALEAVPSGIPALDVLLEGGFPRGEFTEVVGTGDGSGSAQVLHALLRRVAADGQFLALVDGADSFDVQAEDRDTLSHLLWVRCTSADEAFKAADLLLRDRNFPLVVMDLKLNPATQLRKVSASVWYRWARLLEQNQTTVVIISPFSVVSGAACRVELDSRLGIETLSQSPAEVAGRLRFTLQRSATAAATDSGETRRTG